ncbi:FkbM family methyltransferase [Sedimentitalea todarodis]|uniref:FkbM family methyltransferase n=1 Tax=Sedimentitalea todarodis TaxID=1631240 RepID=A0ABU3V9I0_9RHOB|nr:FkbM family methyltransferase [Sedimentitalea todarodis]MDU9002823.1 FkbM family methyltransferase [Sedimentitalea todarodis]
MNSDDRPNTVKPVAIDGHPTYDIEFSFCSLVTKNAQYQAMVQSMVDRGFDESCAEFLYIDNSASNQGDGYGGLNRLANHARGEFVVFCHQDVLALDGPERLREIIRELSEADPHWAVLGNAGLRGNEQFMFLNEQAVVFAAPQRERPEQVESLDENFILLRQDARLGFSCDLEGFHLYATDLVTQAKLRGFSSYAVDFRVEHLGKGTIDQVFYDACNRFEKKYVKALAERSVTTTCTRLDIGNARGDARRHRQTFVERGGQEFVRPSKRLKKVIRTRAAKNMLDVEGIRFEHPGDIPYLTYNAMRKGYYEKPMWRLIRDEMPTDLPVVVLGGGYGVISGLVNRRLGKDQRQVIVEANPQLFDLCRDNALRGGADRELCVLNLAIDYSGVDRVPFDVPADARAGGVVADRRAQQQANAILVPTTTLSQLLASKDMVAPYALICDINGAEFDLISDDPEGLKQCQLMVVKLHPNAFYAQGETISSFLRNLDHAGFEVRANDATVIAASRKPTA